MPSQVQASDEILRTVCFTAVKSSHSEKTEVLMTLGLRSLVGVLQTLPIDVWIGEAGCSATLLMLI